MDDPPHDPALTTRQAHDALMGQLRELVHTTRGQARWEALCAQLEAWPVEALTPLALPYVQGALRGDPTPRVAPLRWMRIRPDALTVHPAWPLIDDVRLLTLRLSARSGQTLLRAEPMRQVRALTLSHNHMTARGARVLADAAPLAQLSALHILSNPIQDQGAQALAQAPCLARLRQLTLRQCGLTDAAADALTQALAHAHAHAHAHAQDATRAGPPPGLHALDLSWNAIRGPAAAALVARQPQLQALSLGANPLGDEGVMALLDALGEGSLRELSLVRVGLTDRGAAALAASPKLATLQGLWLGDNAISPRGAAALAASPHLSPPLRQPWQALAAAPG